MIIAETLKRLINYDAATLTQLIQTAGYKDDKFTSCKFLGMTNGGQFVYMVVFLVEGGTDSTKVYINHREHKVSIKVDESEFWQYN